MLRNIFSSATPASSASLSKTDTAGWKWEVNHDGVVWSWYHPTPSFVSSAPAGLAPAPSPSPAGLAPSPSPAELVPAPIERTTLVEYWYIVNDGVVIPNGGDW